MNKICFFQPIVKITIFLAFVFNLCCNEPTVNNKSSFFYERENKISLQCVKLQDCKVAQGDTSYYGYKFIVSPWEPNLMRKDHNIDYFINGYLYCINDRLIFLDSLINLRSELIEFNSLPHSGEVYFSNNRYTTISKSFYSRFYDEEIYHLRIISANIYENKDDLSIFIGKKNGILGMYTSIPNNLEGNVEVILTYIGDVFPFRYTCDNVVFFNRVHQD